MSFADEFVSRFRWFEGHADVLGLLDDGGFLARTAEALSAPFASSGVAKVAGVEARGFILGTAVALELGVGFVPIRKHGAIHPGAKVTVRTAPDWRGNEPELVLQRRAVATGELVLLVDDWLETGSQARAARSLIEQCGGRWAGLSVLVDQSEETVRRALEPVSAVAAFADLPPSAG